MIGNRAVAIFFLASSALSSPTVRLSTGHIRGRETTEGVLYLGVPFAEPPLGQLRFARTVAKNPWDGILDCFQYAPACMSNTSRTTSPQSVISEDCLYLNVFAGLTCKPETPCPTIVYIHGGGYKADTPRMFPPEFILHNFASKDLVFVTVPYRLGGFGFWSTEDQSASGNWGFYDMIEGLEWVHREIRNFGGDPSKVTLMGHSSGGEAVGLLAVSPRSNRLFHRAIQLSGASLGLHLPDLEIVNSKLAIEVGCAMESEWNVSWNKSHIVACMRGVSGAELLSAQRYLDDQDVIFSGPRVDGNVFPAQPSELLEGRGRINTLTGSVLKEFPPQPPFSIGALRDSCKSSIQSINSALSETTFTNLVETCTNNYLIQSRGNVTEAIGHQSSDTAMFVQIFADADAISQRSQVFLYSFDYQKPGENGPYHSQDLTYLLGIHLFPFDDQDREIQLIYSTLLSNFAKFNDPTPWRKMERVQDDRDAVDSHNKKISFDSQVEKDVTFAEKWKMFKTADGNYFSINLGSENRLHYHEWAVEFYLKIVPEAHIFEDIFPAEPREFQANVVNRQARNPNDNTILVLSIFAVTSLFIITGILVRNRQSSADFIEEDLNQEEEEENIPILAGWDEKFYLEF